MTTTHPPPLVEGPYATYDLATTSILWAAAMVNFKTSPAVVKREQRHIKEQQHEQHQCRCLHEWPEVRRGDQFQVPGSNPVQSWHLPRRSPHQDYLSNGSNGQTKQDLAMQHHQLCKQVQALQVSCHLCCLIWL